MKTLLTIIIPTYNMEKYLSYCLDSLIVEKGLDKLEVLVINDGSGDASSEIAHSYEKKYPNVFRVIDKENGNYGSCINRGLNEAKGKYVKILDADDSFDTIRFEKFIQFLSNVDVDLVLSDFAVVDENRIIGQIIKYTFGNDRIYLFNEVAQTNTFRKMQMHAVTYNRKVFEDLNYHQTEGISYTDQEWIFIPMLRVNSLICFNDYVYKYLVGRNGQTMGKAISPAVLIKNISSTMSGIESMLKSYGEFENEFNSAKKKYFDYRLTTRIKSIYIACFKNFNSDIRKKLIDFDNNFLSINKNMYLSIEKGNLIPILKKNYISIWRANKNFPALFIKIISSLYLYIKNLNVKERDCMDIH